MGFRRRQNVGLQISGSLETETFAFYSIVISMTIFSFYGTIRPLLHFQELLFAITLGRYGINRESILVPVMVFVSINRDSVLTLSSVMCSVN